ncbi:hypothetical protein CMO88_01975 [Candidatus Woesearchaeota archaeon]|nr:hypothetical protein [Candidatus Woesearchaeota archaeon]|tara:strand:+ start:1465 stop:2004 length:540 start_codon:yes stop_codon:yes gene_type:complete
MTKKLFTAQDFNGGPLFIFEGAQYNSFSMDMLASDAILSRHESDYEIDAGRSGRSLPPVQTVADDMLHIVMHYAWGENVPQDISNLITGRKSVVVSTHGDDYPEIGWGINVNDEIVISATDIAERLLSEGYETLMFSVCNPEKRQLELSSGAVIYPLGDFGPDNTKFEMVYMEASADSA